jgi:hypothetical protein
LSYDTWTRLLENLQACLHKREFGNEIADATHFCPTGQTSKVPEIEIIPGWKHVQYISRRGMERMLQFSRWGTEPAQT